MGHDLRAVKQVGYGVNSTKTNSNVKKDYYKDGEHFIPMTNGGQIVVYTNAQTKKRDAVVYDAEGHILRAGVATGAKPKPVVKTTTPSEKKINIFHVKPNSDYAENNKELYSKTGMAPNLRTEKTKDGKGFAVFYDDISDAESGEIDCYSKDGKLARHVNYAKSGYKYEIEHKFGPAKGNYEKYEMQDDGKMTLAEKYDNKTNTEEYYFKGQLLSTYDRKNKIYNGRNSRVQYDYPVKGKATELNYETGKTTYFSSIATHSDSPKDSVIDLNTMKRIQ